MAGEKKIFTKREAEQEVRERTGLEPGNDEFRATFMRNFVPYDEEHTLFVENEFRNMFSQASHGRFHLGNELSRALSEIG